MDGPEPTLQRQKLFLPTWQGPGAKRVRDSDGYEKLRSDRYAGEVQIGDPGASGVNGEK